MSSCRLPDYYKATNTAYEVLIQHQAILPPYPVIEIAKNTANCGVMTYHRAYRDYGLHPSVLVSTSEYGLTLKQKECSLILYREYMGRTVARFTVAHELGHVLLGHTEDDETDNKEANCFARNLLCPAFIALELGLKTAAAYSRTFQVSNEAGQVSHAMHQTDLGNLCPIVLGRFDVLLKNALGKKAQEPLWA